MIRKSLALHWLGSWSMLCAICAFAGNTASAADAYDAAVAHAGRSDADLKRDPLDHPAEILRLSGIKPGMRVADVLAGDGYYSELAGYLVGSKGGVIMINNAAFDHWAGPALEARLKSNRLPNVQHETLDLNHMNLAPASLDAVFLVKVYHDLYWVDPQGLDSEGLWPKIDTGSVPSSLHRIDESYAIKDFESRGLKVVARSDVLKMPDDARDQVSYKGPALGKTDRFVLLFRKTAN
jgi:predicted methyltransferase